jgi:hypothetical protein
MLTLTTTLLVSKDLDLAQASSVSVALASDTLAAQRTPRRHPLMGAAADLGCWSVLARMVWLQWKGALAGARRQSERWIEAACALDADTV